MSPEMMKVVIALVVLVVLGGVFGLILAIAAKVFAVEKDAREEAIAEALPGANCGGCGYAGCGGYAAAVVKGEAPVNACAAGGAAVAAQIGEIMGVSADMGRRAVAMVKCSGVDGRVKQKFAYVGLEDCTSAALIGGGGPNACSFGCLGFGNCVKACVFGAMTVENGVARVDRDLCTGCMRCAEACPKNLIAKVPYDAVVTVPCNSRDKGVVVRAACEVGCIACKLCEKNCEYDAIHVVDTVAVIDYDKCVSCGNCVSKCPRKIILDTRPKAEAAVESAS